MKSQCNWSIDNMNIKVTIFIIFNFSFGNIIMNPYLQTVSTNSIYILVECTTTDIVTVNYGLTPSFGLSTKTSFFQNNLMKGS